MYFITWRRGYTTFLCSNPLYGCISLLGGEVTPRFSVRTHCIITFSVRTHCMDVLHYLAASYDHVSLLLPRFSVRTHCMDVFHYLAVKLHHVSLFEPTVWMYFITWRRGYTTFLCSNPLYGCISLLGGEVTPRFSVRTHCMDVVFFYMDYFF